MTINIREQFNQEQAQYRIQIDLPGFQKDNISVEQAGHRLRVKAVPDDPQDGFQDIAGSARIAKPVDLVVDMKRDLDPETLKVKFDAGVLNLTMGFPEKLKPRMVAVE